MNQQPITQATMQKALSNKQAAMPKTLDDRFEQWMSKIDTRLATIPQSKTGLPGPLRPSNNDTPSSKDR